MIKRVIILITLCCFVFSGGIGMFSPAPVYAQSPVSKASDPAGKVPMFLSKMKEKAQKAMDWVANSKLGKLVGQGIKAVKAGLKWIGNAMKFAKDAKNAAMNSPAYKAAMKSKEIAEVSKKMANDATQTAELAKELKEQIAAAKEETEGKIAALKQNQQQLQSAENASDFAGDAVNMGAQIAAEQERLANRIAGLTFDNQQKILDLANQAKRHLEEFNKKQQELQEILGKKPAEKKDSENLEEVKSKIYIPADAPATIEKVTEVREQRYSTRRDTVYDTYAKVLILKASLESTLEDTENIASLGASMPGGTETTGVATEVINKQTKMLKNYVDMLVLEIKLQTAISLAKSKKYKLEDPDRDPSYFNLCDYVYPKKEEKKGFSVGDALKKAGEMKEKAENAAGTVAGAVNDAKDMAGDAVGAVNDAKNLAQAGQSVVQGAGDGNLLNLQGGVTENLEKLGVAQ